MSEDGTLKPRFFEDVRALFERLDGPAALGRACEAAVRTPLPSLGDVRKLLQVGDYARLVRPQGSELVLIYGS